MKDIIVNGLTLCVPLPASNKSDSPPELPVQGIILLQQLAVFFVCCIN
jgi:hypothetical protein